MKSNTPLLACLTVAVVMAGCERESTPPITQPGDSITPAPPGFFAEISAGYYHACGLTAEEAVYCWGESRGVLGNVRDSASRPVLVTTSGFDTIAAGARSVCGLSSQAALCWGANEQGELGTLDPPVLCGAVPCVPTPTFVDSAVPFRQIAAGGSHTCAIDLANVAYCWGYAAHGRLGYAASTNQPTPRAIDSPLRFQRIDAGGTHTCGIAIDGDTYCWGYGEGGQLGHGFNTSAQSSPARVSGQHTFTDIDVGGMHTCALRLDGALFCWGGNSEGELGNGTTSNSNVPVRAGTQAFTAVTAGGNHSCAIANSGVGYCWGDNEQGQLGDGTRTSRSVPTLIATQLRFVQITAGYQFTCGVTVDRLSVCWGLNYQGALGNGLEALNALTPQRVAAPLQ